MQHTGRLGVEVRAQKWRMAAELRCHDMRETGWTGLPRRLRAMGFIDTPHALDTQIDGSTVYCPNLRRSGALSSVASLSHQWSMERPLPSLPRRSRLPHPACCFGKTRLVPDCFGPGAVMGWGQRGGANQKSAKWAEKHKAA